MPAIMLPMSRFLFFHGLDISLPLAKVLLFLDIRKCFMLFAQISEEENAKSIFSEFLNTNRSNYTNIFLLSIFLRILVCANRLCRGQRPIPKKCLIESNELLRMFVRILVLDYRNDKNPELFVRFVR